MKIHTSALVIWNVNVRQVLPKDAIPSIDEPQFGTAYNGEPDDLVVAVGGSTPKAYPFRILDFHEIVNDEIQVDSGDGQRRIPIAVTWCPLCGSAVVYERTFDGRTLEFGVSGKLADDDLVMYDRETESEWKQSTGRCFDGVYNGRELPVRPAAVMSWEAYLDRHPDGVVLQPVEDGRSEAASEDDTPAEISYDERPYEAYFERDGFGLDAHRGDEDTRTWDRSDIDPKTVVLGLEFDDEAVGFPLPRVLDAGGAVHERVGGKTVVVFATDGGIHAFENPGFTFEPAGDGRFRADSATWDGTTGEADDGRGLTRLPARRLFAFTWRDDHGPNSFFG